MGGVSRTMVDILLEQGHPVRAFVRQDDERAHSLRQAGAEVCPHPAGEAERLRQAG
ncbi:NmrA family NAD(P)-binding protein [Streptomyces shaanxiensis]|uniref:NmrA family NAD(P)-binding protein n=1 Tax=Streptomyces shaanxiensis TaxID=653357 RepID=UPI0031E9ABD0